MIMCHKNFDQVFRLAKRCTSESTKVIVHIDSKSNDISDEMYAKLTSVGYLTDRRISGFIDDRSLIDITMLLIEKAHQIEKEENIHFDYFCLLSGQDYLTKPIEYINNPRWKLQSMLQLNRSIGFSYTSTPFILLGVVVFIDIVGNFFTKNVNAIRT